jgi:hypothetical protein
MGGCRSEEFVFYLRGRQPCIEKRQRLYFRFALPMCSNKLFDENHSRSRRRSKRIDGPHRAGPLLDNFTRGHYPESLNGPGAVHPRFGRRGLPAASSTMDFAGGEARDARQLSGFLK